MSLDVLGLLADLAYMALMGVGVYRIRPSASLPDLERAVRLFMAAALAQFVSAITDLLEVAEDGWLPVVLSAFYLAAAAVTIHLTVRRADRKEGVR